MANTDLCVVIVNYSTPGLVIDCFETLVPQARALGASVTLVDNASPDDSVVRIRRWIEEHEAEDCVTVVESPNNDGFAAGNNLGIESCHANFYLLLNSDTLVGDGALERLLAALASEDEVGLVGPRLRWPDGQPVESCFRYHRPISQLISSANTGLITRLFSRYEVPMSVTERRSFPEWTSFACVMVRREVFERVGLLDDGFFMYFEDVEFCYRARHAGWKILNEPAASVIHLQGGSSPLKSRARQRKRLPRYFYESRTRYFYLLFGRTGLLAANLCWSLGWIVSVLRSWLHRDYRAPACESQWRDIWINFWTPLAAYTHPRAGRG